MIVSKTSHPNAYVRNPSGTEIPHDVFQADSDTGRLLVASAAAAKPDLMEFVTGFVWEAVDATTSEIIACWPNAGTKVAPMRKPGTTPAIPALRSNGVRPHPRLNAADFDEIKASYARTSSIQQTAFELHRSRKTVTAALRATEVPTTRKVAGDPGVLSQTSYRAMTFRALLALDKPATMKEISAKLKELHPGNPKAYTNTFDHHAYLAIYVGRQRGLIERAGVSRRYTYALTTAGREIALNYGATGAAKSATPTATPTDEPQIKIVLRALGVLNKWSTSKEIRTEIVRRRPELAEVFGGERGSDRVSYALFDLRVQGAISRVTQAFPNAPYVYHLNEAGWRRLGISQPTTEAS